MKKILALFLCMTLVLALFSACAPDDSAGPDNGGQVTDGNNAGEDAGTPDNGDGNTGEDIDAPDDENAGNHGEDGSGSGDAAVLDGALSEIIDKIYENKPFDLNLATRDLDISNADELKYNTGLDDGNLISAAAVSEPMMGSQAYSMVLVRAKDAKDAQSIAESMKSGIDTRKWICVEADDLRVVAYDDLILLVMIDSQYADQATADAFVEAFGAVCGGEFDVDLQ